MKDCSDIEERCSRKGARQGAGEWDLDAMVGVEERWRTSWAVRLRIAVEAFMGFGGGEDMRVVVAVEVNLRYLKLSVVSESEMPR